jgi:hypothetical protein
MSDLACPEPVNRFPNCVGMRMHFEEVKKPQNIVGLFRPQNASEIQVSLSVQFSNEEEVDIPPSDLPKLLEKLGMPGGKVKFGIIRGRLKLKLIDCNLPLGKVDLIDELQESTENETQNEIARELGLGLNLGGALGEKPSATGTGTVGLRIGDKTIQKSKFTQYNIHKTGDEHNPQWKFEGGPENRFLTGSMKRKSVGQISVETTPYQLIADFVIDAADDIKISWGHILFVEKITTQRRAHIERLIVIECVRNKINGQPMSELRWQHG